MLQGVRNDPRGQYPKEIPLVVICNSQVFYELEYSLPYFASLSNILFRKLLHDPSLHLKIRKPDYDT